MSDQPTIMHPPGDYAIVELFGHTTLIGRISEVEMYGAKMLALEPLFDDELLPATFHGGAAIYRLTPCSAEIAYKRQPRHDYLLPAAIRATLPTPALTAPAEEIDQEDLFDPQDDLGTDPDGGA